jgi:hypothetical protein
MAAATRPPGSGQRSRSGCSKSTVVKSVCQLRVWCRMVRPPCSSDRPAPRGSGRPDRRARRSPLSVSASSAPVRGTAGNRHARRDKCVVRAVGVALADYSCDKGASRSVRGWPRWATASSCRQCRPRSCRGRDGGCARPASRSRPAFRRPHCAAGGPRVRGRRAARRTPPPCHVVPRRAHGRWPFAVVLPLPATPRGRVPPPPCPLPAPRRRAWSAARRAAPGPREPAGQRPVPAVPPDVRGRSSHLYA